jgi:ABC-type transporter Mla subunit MlaD
MIDSTDWKISQTRLFIATLVVGIISILVGKLVPVRIEWFFFFFAILIPIALMIGYAFINHRAGFFDSTRSQVADNAYFLGFLYFLVSLAITLAKVSVTGDLERRIEVEPIIRGFGVALATTIVGLFLRIILLQNIAGLAGAREKAEEALLNAVNRFHDRTEAISDLLDKASESVHATIKATADSFSETLISLSENHRKTAEEATQAYVSGLITASKTAAEQLGAAIDGLRKKVDELHLPDDALTKKLEPPVAALANVVQTLGTHIQDIDEASKNNATQLKRIGTRLEKLQELLDLQASQLAEAVRTLSTSTETVNGFHAALASANQSVTGLELSLKEVIKELHEPGGVTARIREAVAKTEEALLVLRRELRSTAAGAATDLGAVTKAMGELRTSAQQFAQSTEAAFRGVQDQVASVGTAVAGMRDEVRRNIARTS